jgi:uncharacterized damage-inducible protein DinB
MPRKLSASPSELELLKEWYAFNSAARKKYLQEIFEKIPEEERYRDRGASFPSIVDIFMHVIDAYRSWFIYTYEDRWPEYQRLTGKKRYSRAEVESEEEKIDSLVLGFVNDLEQEDLERWIPYQYKPGAYGAIRVRDMLWHMIEEELQHRGELNALFWQLNIDPPITAWNDEQEPEINEEEYRKAKEELTKAMTRAKK